MCQDANSAGAEGAKGERRENVSPHSYRLRKWPKRLRAKELGNGGRENVVCGVCWWQLERKTPRGEEAESAIKTGAESPGTKQRWGGVGGARHAAPGESQA